MSNMKIVELIATTDDEMLVEIAAKYVSVADLELAINLVDDELISLRERLDRLEQKGVVPETNADKT